MRDLSLAISNTNAIPRKPARLSGLVLKCNLVLLFSLLALGLVYLFQINSLGTKGYHIKSAEIKLKQAESQQKQLEVSISSLRSIARIQQEAQSRNFVPATGIDYIHDGDFALK
jgi:cell division protein FtsL